MDTPQDTPSGTPKIMHTPGLGSTAETPSTKGPTQVTGTEKIHMFGNKRRHEDEWRRTPNTTGTGAIHVKTFHGKLTEDGIVYLDQMVNEWLDAHPQYEVKFVNSTIGTFTGKIKEPQIICQVWV
jgi:hypothetical protein